MRGAGPGMKSSPIPPLCSLCSLWLKPILNPGWAIMNILFVSFVMILIDPLARRWVLIRPMNGHLDRAIKDDGAGEMFPGRGRAVEIDGAAGRCVSGNPSRAGCQGDAPKSKLHGPGLPGRSDKPLRSLRLRVRRRHAARPVWAQIKALAGFAVRQFPRGIPWRSREGLTGFTINDVGRFDRSDGQCDVRSCD